MGKNKKLFNVGDEFILNKEVIQHLDAGDQNSYFYEGLSGVVWCFNAGSSAIGIQFYNWDHGHNLGSKLRGSEAHSGWYISLGTLKRWYDFSFSYIEFDEAACAEML